MKNMKPILFPIFANIHSLPYRNYNHSKKPNTGDFRKHLRDNVKQQVFQLKL